MNFVEVYSFTAEINLPSINVMKKLGLKKIGEFPHPRVDDGNLLKPHVLFKINKSEYDTNPKNILDRTLRLFLKI